MIAFPGDVHAYHKTDYGEGIMIIFNPNISELISDLFMNSEYENFVTKKSVIPLAEDLLHNSTNSSSFTVLYGYLHVITGMIIKKSQTEKKKRCINTYNSIIEYIAFNFTDKISLKSISQHSIFRNNSIGCNCGDSVSYPEKFMFNMLTQLGIDFIWQLTKTNFKWCGKYKYDFYFAINEEEYIIETHGEQHYEKSRNYMSLEKNIKNDRMKYELAIKNGIKPENYIVIDFRCSNLKWGRENIINSRLNQIFDLTNINWEECNMYAIKSNKIKESCDVWNNRKYNESVSTIAKQIGMDRNVLRKYLKKGSELGLCDYDPLEERIKTNKKVYNLNSE